jgi:alpha-ribazole phosphatase
MTTIVDLLRHGEPVGGRAYRGNRIDDPLSEIGWQQMRGWLDSDVAWQRVVTSPLRRCRDFADEVATKYNLPVQVVQDLKEVGFGSWEGKSPEEIQSLYPDDYQAFYNDPVKKRPEGAEPLEDFFKRVNDAYSAVIAQYPGEHILLVTHAGVIRAIVANMLKAPIASMYQLRIDYAGLSRIRYGDSPAKLENFNSKNCRNQI